MDKASKFDTDMTFDMIPDKVQKEKQRQLEKLGPSGPNYKPIKNKISAFEDVLPKPAKKGAFGFPSITKAEGVSLTKEQAEKNLNAIKDVKQVAKKNKKTSFKDVLPKPAKKGPFGVPSTTKAKGVSLKKNKKK
jgi:hypothetical protein